MANNTFVGVTNTDWGDTPGAASLNWSLGTVPTSADDVVFDVTAPGNCLLSGDAECASMNTTGFTHAISLFGYDLDIVGNFNLIDAENGGWQGSGGETVTVGGNLVVGPGLDRLNTACNWDVTGTAVAHEIEITFQDFSAGTALDATDDCLQPTPDGNVAVNFGPVVWNGLSSENTQTNANWTPGEVPHLERDAEVGSAPGNVTGNIVARALDFTGFTGVYTGDIDVYGDLTFSAGMTYPGDDIVFLASGTLTSNGKINDATDLSLDNSFAGGVVCTLAESMTIHYIDAQVDSRLEMGAHTLTINLHDEDESGWYFDSLATIGYSAGAKFLGIGTPGCYIDIETSNPACVTPPVEISGGTQLYISSEPAKMASLLVTGGGIYFDGSPETVGDMTIIGGILTNDGSTSTMNGKTLTVGGDLDISDVDIVVNGSLDVTGTATIHNATIGNMTSTGEVDCTDGCIDDGGNDANFIFVAEAPASGDAQRGFFSLLR